MAVPSRPFDDRLTDLHLQVELLGLRVDENLERMRSVLSDGDDVAAGLAVARDDLIDAINVGLTERCYALCALQSPVAADLRLIMAVVRVSSEMERVGDLALRVVNVAREDIVLLRSNATVHDVLQVMADRAVEAFRAALEAWSTQDLASATQLVESTPMAGMTSHLAGAITRLRGRSAPTLAARSVRIGDALDRIADHSQIIGARVRYLITGDATHLIAEVR